MDNRQVQKPEGLNGQPVLKPPVEVCFVRDASKALHVQVTVRSKLKPASLFFGTLATADFRSQDEVRKKICILAGALAENIAERLGDNLIDPDACANAAGDEWDKLLNKPQSEAIPA